MAADGSGRRGDVLRLRLFGGVEFLGPAASTTLSGAKQRAIAGRLALNAGHAVSVDQLVDAVWGDDSPPSVRASLQVHVSQIRRALADIDVVDALTTVPGGYQLDLPTDSIDLERFERLVADARAAHGGGRHAEALDLALDALELWRGPPLAGTGDAPYLPSALARLETHRIDIVPIAASSAIAVGRVTEVLPQVESLVADHPYSEVLWESVARLLYAQGRQADALDRLATVRRVLRDELGLDLSPATVELERQILNHDPSLAPAAGSVDGSIRTTRSAGEATGSRLPPLRSLIGRDALVAHAVERLTTTRLITLIGPGGVGKTSVAAHVAAEYGATCRDGACFVDLTSVPAGTDPLAALGSALGMISTTSSNVLDDIIEVLAHREQVVVFDNCEHVLPSTAAIVEELTRCSGLRIIATSRERLDIVDELVIDVLPLSAADGAELFLRRAQASVSGFSAAEVDAGDLARIVELVDGIPLALELASPLVRLLSATQIVDELSQDRVISPIRRGARERHASMDVAVAWSYDLLDEDERTLFETFSVFAGGTDLDGVLEVCRSTSDEGDTVATHERARTVELLDSLVSRSLIAVERTAAGIRYRMLVPIQAFARRMLEQSGHAEASRRRHVGHVIAFLEANARIIESADPLPGVIALDKAAANIRAAYRWCQDVGDELLAVEILSSFSIFASRSQTSIPELLSWFQHSLEVVGVPDESRMRVLIVAALFLDESQEASIAQATEAIRLATANGNVEAQVAATAALGHAIGEHDTNAAIDIELDALRLARTLSNHVYEGFAIDYAANHLLRAERREEVAELLAESLALGTRPFGLFGTELAYQRGRVALQAGDVDEARRWYGEAAEAARQIGSMGGRSYALFGMASLAFACEEYERSVEILEECVELDRLVDPKEISSDRVYLARAAARLGRIDVVAEQLDAFGRSDRLLFSGSRLIVVGLLSMLNDERDVAARSFADAAESFAEIGSSTHLATAFDEWARCVADSDPGLAQLLREMRARLRDGAISPADALAGVDSAVAANST